MPQIILWTLFILSGPLFRLHAWAVESSTVKPVVILDPGHTNKMPGAISITGKYEVVYNDNLVAKLSGALGLAGYVVVLTRKPDQEISKSPVEYVAVKQGQDQNGRQQGPLAAENPVEIKHAKVKNRKHADGDKMTRQ